MNIKKVVMGTAVHCDTLEKVSILFDKLDKMGYKDCCGLKLEMDDNINYEEYNCCYIESNRVIWRSLDWCKSRWWKIIQFDELEWEE